MAERSLAGVPNTTTLADLIERVLDKGVVIAGDIKVLVANVELLTIKIRLLVASVDKAMEIGVNWWQSDPNLNSQVAKLAEAHRQLEERLIEAETAQIESLERRLAAVESTLQRQDKEGEGSTS
jgi:hypothetical protein